jgi:hypothetical protein
MQHWLQAAGVENGWGVGDSVDPAPNVSIPAQPAVSNHDNDYDNHDNDDDNDDDNHLDNIHSAGL